MMCIRDHLVQLAQQGRDRATDAAAVERPGAAVGSPPPLEVEFLAWGDPDSDASAPCEILATLGSVELEYAAIQRGVGIMDAPHRGAITVKGAKRLMEPAIDVLMFFAQNASLAAVKSATLSTPAATARSSPCSFGTNAEYNTFG